MDVKTEVTSRPTIMSLIQAVHLMTIASDIFGIECWVLI
jgi:hypothetical protein